MECSNMLSQDVTHCSDTGDYYFDRFDVCGVGFHACTHASAVTLMERWISKGRDSHYVCVSNVFDVRLAHRNPEIRRALRDAHLVVPDGMPVVWAGRLLGDTVPMRVDGATLMWAAMTAGLRSGRRHFFYGGTASLLDTLTRKLKDAMPDLQIAGTMPHPFRDLTSAEETLTIRTINEAEADYLWVGIGTERQLVWMNRQAPALRVPVIVGVGAAFAFHAGLVPRAPRWMQDCGLEWLFRLSREPRLWRRYLLVNPPFLLGFTRQWVTERFVSR